MTRNPRETRAARPRPSFCARVKVNNDPLSLPLVMRPVAYVARALMIASSGPFAVFTSPRPGFFPFPFLSRARARAGCSVTARRGAARAPARRKYRAEVRVATTEERRVSTPPFLSFRRARKSNAVSLPETISYDPPPRLYS